MGGKFEAGKKAPPPPAGRGYKNFLIFILLINLKINIF